MPSQPDNCTAAFRVGTAPSSSSVLSSSRKIPNRKFFHNVQPSFAVSRPTAQQLKFLDNSDPGKNVVVRKNAREWVHRNKQQVLDVRTKRPESKGKNKHEVDRALEPRRKDKGPWRIVVMSDPRLDVAAGKPDPFDAFPAVGRKIDHIIEYFLTSCPEEIPCSDDKYAWRPQDPQLQLSKENTVLGNMAEGYASFVLWLYATTLIRDGTTGTSMSEETLYYYRLSLEAIQKALNEIDGGFDDPLIRALGCFAACACFGGMFEAAQMHSDAMCKTITLRGKGDIAAGFSACTPFTRKASQWCEFGVAAYKRVLSALPYMPPPTNTALPYNMILQSERLAYTTFTNIPPVSLSIQNIFLMLHQIALAQGQRSVTKEKALDRANTDSVTIRLLYDAEYALLQMIDTQKSPDHTYSAVDIMFTEACQLFLWIGARDLPYELKLCDQFVVFLKDAIARVLQNTLLPVGTVLPNPVVHCTPAGLSVPATSNPSAPHINASPRAAQNATLWALYLGTITTGVRSRPDYGWYSEHFRLQAQAMGLRTLQDVEMVIKLFPYSTKWRWSNIRKLEPLIGDYKSSGTVGRE
ncbi:hypothetical protein DM02DRAFT_560465 [Periconia macrospinosa]|uniref:Uncharacterized protein n=1 Tax=Periconia macrospinosa TaxID=97972 RepID=A0A2V1DUP7_9PLEO|nr:hypothetical protein DM02DRAFT_560465 [Periconia macrospinosa]